MRNDIVEICRSAYINCRPKILNIPTNGILSEVIYKKVAEIVQNLPEVQIIVNLSLDEIGANGRTFIRNGGPPWRMARVIKKVRSVAMEVVPVGPKMVVDHVQKHHQPARVGRIDEMLQCVGAAIGAMGRIHQDAVISPAAIA